MQSLLALKNSIQVFSHTYGYLKRSKASPDSILDLKLQWAEHLLRHLKVRVEVVGRPSDSKPLLFVGNHISYLDIPLLLKSAPDISFIAKKEIASWPIFGPAAKVLDTIFVQREKPGARKNAREALKLALEGQKRVAIFPSGTTCMIEAKPWRYGGFEVAEQVGALIQPFRISYTPLRAAAYIDQDFFPLHLFRLARLSEITARIEFHDPMPVRDPVQESQKWQDWARLGRIH